MPAADRLINYYNENDYEPNTNPGGFDDGGHRYNFIDYLRDVSEVGSQEATLGAAALLLHGDGADGSTTITDEGGHTVTASNGAQIDTAQSKFGGSSILINGGIVTVTNHADFNFGTGDFTIDFWIRRSDTNQHNVLNILGGPGYVVYFVGTQVRLWNGSTDVISGSPSTATTNTWHHVALTRASNNFRLFLNGVQEGSTHTASVSLSGGFSFGAYPGPTLSLSGWMDEIRIVNGTAVWTADFVPPAGPYLGNEGSEILARLGSYYNEGDYHAIYNPGGFGNGGHRYNYINALRDVADVAQAMGVSDDAVTRLDTYYTATTYNASTNPGGMARGGHRINFDPSLDDAIVVGRGIGDQGLGIRLKVSWLEMDAPTRYTWLPIDLGSALKLWLDASNSSTITVTGSGVSQWNDRSGNANHATQSTDVDRPSVASAILNGRDAIFFDAANTEFMALPNFISAFSAGSMVALAKLQNDPPTDGNYTGPIFEAGTSSSMHEMWIDGYSYDTFGTTVRRESIDITPSLSSWYIRSNRAANNDWELYINGTSARSVGTNTVAFNSNPCIGVNNGGNYLNGHIAEIIITNTALSTTDRQKAEGYLAHKWGVTSVLPSDHPYKTSPPGI